VRPSGAPKNAASRARERLKHAVLITAPPSSSRFQTDAIRVYSEGNGKPLHIWHTLSANK